VSVSADGQSR
jgi:type I restriction enzyme M protein